MKGFERGVRLALGAVAALTVAACGVQTQPVQWPGEENYGPDRETVWGDGGAFGVFGNQQRRAQDQAAAGIGVNSFLWRASLDTMGFMPLASADPFGGVILTDWYAPAESPGERFKASVFILGRDLRADGVRVSVFRQVRDPSGQWMDAPVDPAMATDLENAILTRARQLRSDGTN
ncbi:DUF3576 domain-containing protein [Telmatospirillum sp. J64-1]|uniref:DUF3576 domain-containing protein n=1 Tax=Telmatospirillum sp. J64-1 TaxID=2502183 RepID=UPI00115DEB86|nr:DUF3576 domain-containing protein [Telmatospirillum sp. J64-1]